MQQEIASKRWPTRGELIDRLPEEAKDMARKAMQREIPEDEAEQLFSRVSQISPDAEAVERLQRIRSVMDMIGDEDEILSLEVERPRLLRLESE